MPRTFIHTSYIRTRVAGQKGSARLHGLVEYATEGSQAAEYAEREGMEPPEWRWGDGWPMETWEAHAWIDEQYGEHAYARTFVLSPAPEAGAASWTEDERNGWVQGVMNAMGYEERQYIYTWHEDEAHPHAHVIAFDDRSLTREDLAAGREMGDQLAQEYTEEHRQEQEMVLALCAGDSQGHGEEASL